MEHSDLLRHATQVCEGLGLTYLVTGSTATIVYGEPRFTNDIDIVVDLPPALVSAFCAGFPDDQFYISEAAVSDAVRRQHQFNVLHPSSGLKIDFIVMTNSDFDQSRRRRARSLAVFPDRKVSFVAPEDVIIKKMAYFQEGGSDKHLRDIAGVLRIQGPALDRAYISDWAARFGLDEIWRQILAANPNEEQSF
jgi:hypothetical protein